MEEIEGGKGKEREGKLENATKKIAFCHKLGFIKALPIEISQPTFLLLVKH